MIKNYYKLTWKDINYIMKKRNMLPCSVFSVLKVPQYSNRDYNQFSIQISTKISKHATKRNFLKRLFFDFIKENNYLQKQSNWNYYKYFFVTNKNSIEKLKDTIELKDKNNIKIIINSFFQATFNRLFFANEKHWLIQNKDK